jgi:hypothetical protein
MRVRSLYKAEKLHSILEYVLHLDVSFGFREDDVRCSTAVVLWCAAALAATWLLLFLVECGNCASVAPSSEFLDSAMLLVSIWRNRRDVRNTHKS